MQLTIGIPVYNGQKVLRDCLFSIYKNIKDIDFEVIVCDDGSTDGTAEMVKKEFPQVQLLKNSQNRGVSRSMNKIRQRRMRGRYFLRLDADTKVLPGSIEGLINFLDKHPNAGIVASALVDKDGNFQRNYQEGLQTPIWWFKEYALWISKGWRIITNRFQGAPSTRGGFRARNYKSHNQSYARQVPVLGSAVILVRREVINKVGFDENTPFFMEDADFTMEIRKAGWEAWYCPCFKMQHLGGHSDDKFYIHCRDRSLQSLYYFTKKHFPGRFNQTILTASILFGSAISLILAVLFWLPSRFHSRAKVIVNRAIRSFGNVFRWHGRNLKTQISKLKTTT